MIGILIVAVSAMCACVIAQPEICDRAECMPFTVLEEFPTYQLRRYPRGMFVKAQTQVSEDRWLTASTELYGKLYAYISGANDQGTTIPMTAPLLSEFIPTTTLSNHNHMSMYIYLGAAQLDSAPEPTNLAVEVVELPEREYYVSTFGVYRGKEGLMREIDLLVARVGNTAMFDRNFVVKAAYNRPQQTTGTIHNEVWLLKL